MTIGIYYFTREPRAYHIKHSAPSLNNGLKANRELCKLILVTVSSLFCIFMCLLMLMHHLVVIKFKLPVHVYHLSLNYIKILQAHLQRFLAFVTYIRHNAITLYLFYSLSLINYQQAMAFLTLRWISIPSRGGGG